MIWNRNFVFYPYFENHMPLDKPPLLFSILNSILTQKNGYRIPTLDVSDQSREILFDFNYPLSDAVDKAVFERTWIDHFLQRRIGEETFTAFKLQMRSRINEIMPFYNPLFDALGEKYDIFSGDGYNITIHEEEDINRDIADYGTENRTETDNGTLSTSLHSETDSTVDNRYSDTPQNQLTNVQNGTYLTDYTYNSSDGSVDTTNETETENTRTAQNRTSNTTDDDTARELDRTEIRTGKVASTDALIKYMNETRNLYTAIYRDCDDLFYQLF